MTYRIDIETREGRAFIERMFNRAGNQREFSVYGVALSGDKALERDREENEKWLSLVDTLIEASHTVKANMGDWKTTNEGGLLCLVNVCVGLRFEAEFLELAQELGEKSEEAILAISPRGDHFDARLLWQDKSLSQILYWQGGQ